MERILVVDDNDALMHLLQKMLHRSGYEVVQARNGREALELYDPQTINLVLTDLVMPEKEGLELIAELRRMNPEVKIIAMSGGGRNNPNIYLPIAEHLGAIGTLAKPFSNDELLGAVRSALLLMRSPA